MKTTKSDLRRTQIVRICKRPKSAVDIAEHLNLGLAYTKKYLRQLILEDYLLKITKKDGEFYKTQMWVEL